MFIKISLNHNLSKTVAGPNKQMNSSLPSYDLQRLFHNIHTTPTTKVKKHPHNPNYQGKHSHNSVFHQNKILERKPISTSCHHQESGGESLITDETVFTDASINTNTDASIKADSNNSIMTDSLHAVVWEEAEDQQ